MQRQVGRALHALLIGMLGFGGPALAQTSTGPTPEPPVFQQPGVPPAPAPPVTDNLGAVPPPSADLDFESIPVPDRNRIMDALGITDDPLNPYRQNTVKADRPLFDDWFINLSAISDTVVEPNSKPVPTSIVAAYQPQDNDTFGRPRALSITETVLPSIDIIKGDTAFKPPDFEFRFEPAANYNFNHVEELGLLNVDPLKGTIRNDAFFAVQEAFVQADINDADARYDFDSVRLGIQPFNADFRGFLFQDEQLGARLLGDRFNNQVQYNLAYFRRVEKDTNSGLNDLSKPLRRDNIVIANVFVQDLPTSGFTTEASVVENWNRESEFTYDRDGFLVRPTPFGFEDPHKYNVTYFGLNGDGHLGRVNLMVSSYYALGNDSESELSGTKADIKAWFVAAEPSMDFDYVRVRGSFLYASGDKSPYGHTETGFDAIEENPQFAGADTSYWIREAIPLIGGGGVQLIGNNSVLPALRSSKDQGQSNFLNPGVVLIGAGVDVDVLPELRLSANANHLEFDDTAVLEALRQQANIPRDIGLDVSASATWRPFDTQNVVLRTSGAMLLPGDGFKALFNSERNGQVYYSVLTNIILTY